MGKKVIIPWGGGFLNTLRSFLLHLALFWGSQGSDMNINGKKMNLFVSFTEGPMNSQRAQ